MNFNHNHYQFIDLADVSQEAAVKIVPVLTQIIGVPDSVVDLGGGTGAWCKAFKQIGSSKVRCIDSPSVLNSCNLLIDKNEFIPMDLSRSLPPIEICNLAISTEFCEHIPKSQSEHLVEFLTQSSNIILFSSAIPGQGGIGHINEQRPSYWQTIFSKKGYERLDVIRPLIIFELSIPSYLRQNLYLYVKTEESYKIHEKFRLIRG